MTRTINLVVYSNGARPAHQAIFIPTGDTGQKGKVIHVVGTTATGFFLQFKRNYDFSVEDRKYKVLPLAVVEDGVAKDTVGNGEPTEDTIARDKLESVATIVQPPGPSLKPFAPGVCAGRLGRWGMLDAGCWLMNSVFFFFRPVTVRIGWQNLWTC